jgi:hypothetical protein
LSAYDHKLAVRGEIDRRSLRVIDGDVLGQHQVTPIPSINHYITILLLSHSQTLVVHFHPFGGKAREVDGQVRHKLPPELVYTVTVVPEVPTTSSFPSRVMDKEDTAYSPLNLCTS